MTRSQVMKNYEVDPNGKILTPGKFYGEPVYVPALWEYVSLGMSTQCKNSPGYEVIAICKDDIEEFPELAGYLEADFFEDSDGYVWLKSLREWT